jgi:hypothetical protein
MIFSKQVNRLRALRSLEFFAAKLVDNQELRFGTPTRLCGVEIAIHDPMGSGRFREG